MSLYIARVELHSGQYIPDFVVLHNAMQTEGFKRLIASDSGKIYHLPRGEYSILTNKDRLQVLDAVKRAVAITGRSAEILVTESAGCRWDGLTEQK